MKYNTDQMKKAMAIARHAYSDRIDKKGHSCFLMACASAEQAPSESKAMALLLKRALEETNLTMDEIIQADFEDAVINDLLVEGSLKSKYLSNNQIESLTA
ncbi:MAG: hypothetical protein RR614_04345 [Eubacterium sp.]